MRHRSIIAGGRVMRHRSLIAGVVVVLLVAAALYYFYGYRDRAISADISAVRSTTSDMATTTAVKTALSLSNRVSAFAIGVDTSGGVVTLSGQVSSDEDKRMAEEIARGTKGVSNVVNNLQVDPQVQAANAEKQRVTDLEIKAGVLEALYNNAELKTQPMKVEVGSGMVKLSGSVQTEAQKAAAEAAARGVANVRTVDSSALAVTGGAAANPAQAPPAAVEDDKLAAQVEAALLREKALAEPQNVNVRASAGIVYLSGMVGSETEKALAGHMAKAVAGTKDVVNNLEVTAAKKPAGKKR